MSHSIREYLHHIRDEVEFLLTGQQGLEKELFFGDEVRKRAFVRSLEIIGEVVKRLPPSLLEQYPQIPWRSITGMSDRLIHGYFGINYEVVWETLTIGDTHSCGGGQTDA